MSSRRHPASFFGLFILADVRCIMTSSLPDPANITADGLRCSMLMKLAPDASDIWFGHATWDSFSNMAPRLYKTYTLPVHRDGGWTVHTVAFSSSPSWLSSIDDWYDTPEYNANDSNAHQPTYLRMLEDADQGAWVNSKLTRALAISSSRESCLLVS